jgi:hypothetical protein
LEISIERDLMMRRGENSFSMKPIKGPIFGIIFCLLTPDSARNINLEFDTSAAATWWFESDAICGPLNEIGEA